MNIILVDISENHSRLMPLTANRSQADLRCGIFSIREKWEHLLAKEAHVHTLPYLQAKYELPSLEKTLLNVYINASYLPDKRLLDYVWDLESGHSLWDADDWVLFTDFHTFENEEEFLERARIKKHDLPFKLPKIQNLWDLFLLNASQIEYDMHWVRQHRQSVGVKDKFTAVYGEENVFVEEGAVIKAAVINAENGPVYIAKNAVVGEGALIHGSFALLEGAQLTMGAKMRGDSTIGPYCKVGGEVSNSVFLAYSNKGHDGFLGNSVIGEWCNLGAHTTNSNLKNNYSEVKVWSYHSRDYVPTGQVFCGLFMGDHAKSGINTMFNTGTVVGIGANVFGEGFPPKFIPSFSWGGFDKHGPMFEQDRFFEMANLMMKRRGKAMDSQEQKIVQDLYELKIRYEDLQF